MLSFSTERQKNISPNKKYWRNNFTVYYKEYIDKINDKFIFNEEEPNKKPQKSRYGVRRIISNDDILTLNNEGILVIHIKDTGIGMKESDLDQIFQPFYQANTEAKHQGTGLGLWITKQLVSSMGGLISVKSKFGHGTLFKVIIPMKLKINQQIPFKSIEVLKSFSYKHNNYKANMIPPSPELQFKEKADPESNSHILLTYNSHKERMIIDDLFFNSNSQIKNNQDFVTYNYNQSKEVIQTNMNEINSIILFSINQFAVSLYFANQIREIEIARKSYHIPILIIGSKEVKDHAKDFMQIGVKNFVYDIFNLKVIFKEFIRMMKQEIMFLLLRVNQKSIKNLEQTIEDAHKNLDAGKLLSNQSKILIIDDDVFSADALKRMIEKAGSYSITNIYNGKKVLL